MTQQTIDGTLQQQTARDAMSTAGPGPGITSRNELDRMTGRDILLAMVDS